MLKRDGCLSTTSGNWENQSDGKQVIIKRQCKGVAGKLTLKKELVEC